MRRFTNHAEQTGVSELDGRLTGDQGEGAYAGKGGDVQVHPLQVAGEFNDAVNPLPEAPQALEPVPHRSIAEDQFPVLRAGSET